MPYEEETSAPFGEEYLPQDPRAYVPRRQELRKFPKTVLLKIAIELDPDRVAESYEEGWTKDDILRVIERHVKSALGIQSVEGWPYIQDVEIFDSEVEEEEEDTHRILDLGEDF